MMLRTIFLNDVGRLRSGWRLLLFVVAFYASLLGLGAFVKVTYYLLLNFVPTLGSHSYIENMVFRIVLLLAALIAGYVCNRWLEGLPWRALGLGLHRRWFQHLLVGSVIGLASLAFATAIATAGGGLSFKVAPGGLWLLVLRTLISSAALFLVAACAEEALFRGYPLQTLTRARLAWLAILLTSLPFAAAHLENPNSALLGSINTALAGVWFAVAYLRTRSLWFPLGLHWAWNWALGSLFGLPVSGLSLTQNTLLRGADHGPAWLTGGAYGIEGGIACTIALAFSTIFIWRTRFLKADEELVKLTSQENPTKRDSVTIPGSETTALQNRERVAPGP